MPGFRLRTRGFVILSLLSSAVRACGAPSGPDTSIDFIAEREVMFACGHDMMLERELTIESLSDARQTITSAWELDGDVRERVLFQVVVHPVMGPALRAALMREGWVGEGDPNLDAPTLVGGETDVDGWRPFEPGPNTERWEREFIGEVQRCWESRRGAIYADDQADNPGS